MNASTKSSQPSDPSPPRFRWRAPFAIVIALTLLSAVVHGQLDGRWAEPEDLIAQGQQLDQLPTRCGSWVLLQTQELDEGAARLLRCYGSTVRVYQNEETKQMVNVAVLFGPRGPIAVHTPEICYSSVGTAQVGERSKQVLEISGQTQELWSVQFAEKFSNGEMGEPSLNVWYAWSAGGAWVAAENPRFWMTPNLYKIQVAAPMSQTDSSACKDFMKEFLPKLKPLISEQPQEHASV